MTKTEGRSLAQIWDWKTGRVCPTGGDILDPDGNDVTAAQLEEPSRHDTASDLTA
jgi:hypothetical protein